MKTEKRSVRGTRLAVTNHPRASAAAVEMFARGGNAVDAAIAALFALTVVEPMMVGILGGGFFHLRLPDGQHVVIDNQCYAPAAGRPDMYEPDPLAAPGTMDTLHRANAFGPSAVAVPGNLAGWTETQARFGTLSLAEVMEPAVRLATDGFRVTPFLGECIAEAATDLARDPEIAGLFLPGGRPICAGERIVMADYAGTLRTIARMGARVLYGGTLGKRFARHMKQCGGYLSITDLTSYRTKERTPLRSSYRGYEIIGPPPPASGPLHILEMLHILEGFDVGGMGFHSIDRAHLIVETLKIVFADRAAATADPDFVAVPIDRLLDPEYAAKRAQEIDPGRARDFSAGVAPAVREGAHTTHVTVADESGLIVCATQTINNLFGARYVVPGTGMIPNNYMHLFTPSPGYVNSIEPGKRVTSSMSPVIVLQDGEPRFALGLPGGLRIFASVAQALINLIDHRMTLQEAVEAPRVWSQGYGVEVERDFGAAMLAALAERGHPVSSVSNIGGGMGAIAFQADGEMEGAACWQGDGTAIAFGGGLARPGIRFAAFGTREPRSTRG